MTLDIPIESQRDLFHLRVLFSLLRGLEFGQLRHLKWPQHVSEVKVRRPLVTWRCLQRAFGKRAKKFSINFPYFASVGSPGQNLLTYETSRGGRTPESEHACVTFLLTGAEQMSRYAAWRRLASYQDLLFPDTESDWSLSPPKCIYLCTLST